MTELIQHKIIRCTDIKYQHRCMTCTREFIAGQDRHEWRTYILYTDVNASITNGGFTYRKCGYWVTSCHECFVKNMVIMRDNINEQLDSMPESMRELA